MAKYIRTEEGYKTLEEIGAVTAYTEFKRYKLIEKQSVSVPEDGYKELVTETVMPTKGATYFVTLNRTQYECVAWWNHNWRCIVIGNGSLADMEGMGEDVPFVIDFYCNEDNYTYAYLNADGGEYTILIEGLEPIHKLDKKYLPDSVINSIDNAQTMAETAQAMAETAQTMAEQKSDWNADEDEAGHVLNRTHWSETVYGEVLPLTKFKAIYALGDTNVALLPVAKFEVGKTYTVVYDGTTYTCEAKNGEVDGVYIIGVGNDMLFGGEQTTEPFAVGYDVTANMTGIIPLTDTESVHSVQITGEKTVYHKIPREYLYSKRIEFTLGGEDVPGYWYAYTNTDIRDIINDAENGVFQYATITFPMQMDERTVDLHLTMPLASHETFTMDDGITVHRVQFECEIELDKRYIFVTSIDACPEAGLSFSGLTKKVADSIKVDTAEVGQTIVVKSVDENGKPTAWAAADLPSGFTERKLIHSITLEEQVDNVTLQIPYSSFNGATEFEIVMNIKKADEVTTTDTASGKLKIVWHSSQSTTLNSAVPTGNISYINFVKSRIQVSYGTFIICNSAIIKGTAVAPQNQNPILNSPNQAIVCNLVNGHGATIIGDYPFGSGSTFNVYLLNAKE